MIYEAQWAQVKVGDFFQGYNWPGAAPVLESSVTEASLDALPSQMCWSVADFFAQGNWTIHRATTTTEVLPTLHRPEESSESLSITASVLDFCRGINWQGQGSPKPLLIASPGTAEAKKKEPVAKVGPTIGLEDLSDLF